MQEFLAAKGVDYTERNVAEDPTAMAELEALGYFTTPVTIIDGEAVVGFDRANIERLLSD